MIAGCPENVSFDIYNKCHAPSNFLEGAWHFYNIKTCRNESDLYRNKN